MQTTKTTVRLKLPDPRRLWNLPVPVAAAIVVFCLIVLAALVGRIASAPAVAVQPTASLPIIILATAQPVAAPVVAQQVAAAAPVGNVTRRAIVVYGAADLASAIGAVEPGRAFEPVAHFGADWMIVDMAGSGRVYVRVSDLYDIPALIDLKPAAPAQVIVQPIYVEQPNYQVDTQPEQQPEQQAAPTPAQEYQVLTERQRNIQEHYVDIPAIAPMEMNPVNQEWARVQGCAEHPEWHC